MVESAGEDTPYCNSKPMYFIREIKAQMSNIIKQV